MLTGKQLDPIFYKYYNDDLQFMSEHECVKHYGLYGKQEGRCINLHDALHLIGYKQYIDIELLYFIDLDKLKSLNPDITLRWLHSIELFLYWFIALDTKNERALNYEVADDGYRVILFDKKMVIKEIDVSKECFSKCLSSLGTQSSEFLSIWNKIEFLTNPATVEYQKNYFSKNFSPKVNINRYADSNPDLKLQFANDKYLYIQHFETIGYKEKRDTILNGRNKCYSGNSVIQEVFDKTYHLINSRLTLSSIDDKLIHYYFEILNEFSEYDQFLLILRDTLKMLITQLYIRKTTQLLVFTTRGFLYRIAFDVIHDSRFNGYHIGSDAVTSFPADCISETFHNLSILRIMQRPDKSTLFTDRLLIVDVMDQLNHEAITALRMIINNDLARWRQALIVVQRKQSDEDLYPVLKSLFTHLSLTAQLESCVADYALDIYCQEQHEQF